MGRFLALLYGISCYVLFLGSFLYAIWFLWRRIDAVPLEGKAGLTDWVINAALLGAFAVQHSVMARQGFKKMWTRVVPACVERSTYVLLASFILFAVCWLWRPIPPLLYRLEGASALVLEGLYFLGFAIVVAGTFLIDHLELFGLKQVWTHFQGRAMAPAGFQTPGLYKIVRHPIYFGFLMAFWSTPQMSLGRVLFAGLCTGYVLVAIQFEERDLIRFFGDRYREYRRRVSMLFPLPPRRS